MGIDGGIDCLRAFERSVELRVHETHFLDIEKRFIVDGFDWGRTSRDTTVFGLR